MIRETLSWPPALESTLVETHASTASGLVDVLWFCMVYSRL